ncbi:MAG: hypothetical protein OFPI_39240 [Osedax symbiont Rs2]|nr:MAG: hypothetical protein OFPI_39240 [Osedax symbiont Rs2]
MHERERHRIILAETAAKPVVTISYLVELLDASEATIRRDVNSLHAEDKLRKVRGGAESLHPPTSTGLAGRPFAISQSINAKAKKSIALAAAALCKEGESIIIGGGSTAFMMAEHIKHLQLDVMTNSFMIADFLLKEGKCSVTVPSGKIYREQNLILSPYPEDGTSRFYASKMFFGAQGLGNLGVMETDPQIVQGTSRLLRQTEQRILLVDSSKFTLSSSMIICSLNELDTVITDQGVSNKSVKMIEASGCRLIIAGESSS